MPEPLAICLEDLAARPGAGRFLRCVAVPGRGPGLRVGADGPIRWRAEGPDACELWVSADDRLILLRPAGAPPVRVTRDGRSVDAPEDKPVVLIDGDEVDAANRRLRVHVHGPTSRARAPSPMPDRAAGGVSLAAAAMALGAAVLGCDRDGRGGVDARPVEVRTSPPDVGPAERPIATPDAATPDATTPDAATPDAATPDAARRARRPEPIEIRHRPPAPPRHERDPEDPLDPE